MNVLDFGIEVIALSASGVLAPGPLFFANLAYATRLDRWSGVKVAHGHTVVELPLIIMLAAGLFTFDVAKKYSGVIGFVGGIAILGFASLQIATITNEKRAYNLPRITSADTLAVPHLAAPHLDRSAALPWRRVDDEHDDEDDD